MRQAGRAGLARLQEGRVRRGYPSLDVSASLELRDAQRVGGGLRRYEDAWLPLWAGSLSATVLVPADLGELAADAHVIARGRVVAVEGQVTDDRRRHRNAGDARARVVAQGAGGARPDTLRFACPADRSGATAASCSAPRVCRRAARRRVSWRKRAARPAPGRPRSGRVPRGAGVWWHGPSAANRASPGHVARVRSKRACARWPRAHDEAAATRLVAPAVCRHGPSRSWSVTARRRLPI